MTAWDALTQILASPVIVCVLSFFGVLLIVLVITGHGKIQIKGVELSAKSKETFLYREHLILRNQIIWVSGFINGQAALVHSLLQANPDGVSTIYEREPEYYVKYCLNTLTGYIIINWIALNHVKRSDIATKARELLHFLGSVTKNVQYDEAVFGEYLIHWTETIIDNLIQIRKKGEE